MSEFRWPQDVTNGLEEPPFTVGRYGIYYRPTEATYSFNHIRQWFDPVGVSPNILTRLSFMLEMGEIEHEHMGYFIAIIHHLMSLGRI